MDMKNYEEEMSYILEFQKTDSKEKKEEILKLFIDKYENLLNNLAHSFVRKYTHTPLTFEDIKQLTMYYLYLGLDSYDTSKGKFFASYAKEKIYYDVSNYSRKFITNKHKMMNTMSEYNDELTSLEISEYKSETLDLIKSNYDIFTSNEKEVLDKLLENKKLVEISTELNKSIKSIYSTLGRARKKIDSLLKSINNKTN